MRVVCFGTSLAVLPALHCLLFCLILSYQETCPTSIILFSILSFVMVRLAVYITEFRSIRLIT